MIISRGPGKGFSKIQHLIMMKALDKTGIRQFPQHDKRHLWKTYT